MKKIKATVLVFAFLMILALFPPALAWELERPADFIAIEEREENAFSDGKASVGLGVHVHEYYENSDMFGYNDAVGLRIVGTANSRWILEYCWSEGYYNWFDESSLPNQLFMEDDQVFYVSLPFPVRFYGGPESVEYEAVWICINGLLSFLCSRILFHGLYWFPQIL